MNARAQLPPWPPSRSPHVYNRAPRPAWPILPGTAVFYLAHLPHTMRAYALTCIRLAPGRVIRGHATYGARGGRADALAGTVAHVRGRAGDEVGCCGAATVLCGERAACQSDTCGILCRKAAHIAAFYRFLFGHASLAHLMHTERARSPPPAHLTPT